MGGMLKAIENGYPQREIQDAAYKYQKAVESEDAVVVGVNKFRVDEDETIPILRVDPKIERDQVERLRAIRDRRDNSKTDELLKKIEDAASIEQNLLPLILDAVEHNVTVGEISHKLRKVWGEYQERTV